MRHVDFSPLYGSTIGFDRLFNLLDTLGHPDSPEKSTASYPPYNINRIGDNAYRISMAVAGFSEKDLSIEVKENSLFIKGEQASKDNETTEILFSGITTRNFERRFQIADHVEVRDAHLENGLLHIDLIREIPDAMKARKIKISEPSSTSSKRIDRQ
ncbi:Hsp20 family protein [Candidatus Endowatersipora endosymbiont of Watersipora subatra]|uniref:Hsp20 family protein n=1 Tax=Candidatus Endowatersipora endosymbiont of Watersipora subatra TaxID=3077946 RepID=UPI00312C7CC7